VSNIDEVTRLLTLADAFVKAARSRVTDRDADRAIGAWEREGRDNAVAAVERLDEIIEKGGKSPSEIDDMTVQIGLNGLQIADVFAAAVTRILGVTDAYIFLPAEARTIEMAKAYDKNHAPALAALCRRSLV
jgi:hypothetical protein